MRFVKAKGYKNYNGCGLVYDCIVLIFGSFSFQISMN